MQIKDFFEAQHQLPDTEFLVTKACNNYHGHTYKAEVSFDSDESNMKGGMIIDFKEIKGLIATLDHTAIYQKGNPMIDFIHQKKPEQVVVELDVPPSSENISIYLYNLIMNKYGSWGIKNLEVRICEGYKGEERASYSTYAPN